MSMPSSLGYLALVAVVGGAVGGVIGRVTAPSPEASRTTASAETAQEGAPSEPSGVDGRLRELERAVRDLERERKIRRVAEAYAPSGEERGDAAAGAPAIDDPVFEAAVRDVMDQVREEQRTDRDTRRQERRQQMLSRWGGELQTALTLTAAQRQQVEKIASDYFEELAGLRDTDGGPQTRDEWRTQMRALQEKNDAKLTSVLDSTQRSRYEALEEDKKLGFGMGGGGRRRGPN